ncbi:N-glycosylase/DNA lyase [Hetaerina americana]|uniref:N-glycosylase/DNA lyase n=1 Tax=Hetaerina americana TaxID=62018 RepID=UPI003A7F37D7
MFQLFPPSVVRMLFWTNNKGHYIFFKFSSMRNSNWQVTSCKREDLQLNLTLTGGQSFRWKYSEENGEFTGVFADRVWKLKQSEESLFFKTYGKPNIDDALERDNGSENRRNRHERVKKGLKTSRVNVKESPGLETEEDLLRQYLRLDVDLQSLYDEWGSRDPHFAEAAKAFFGVRILKQEPVENIFSFICATNNHISRISSMVEKMCIKFGVPIAEVDGAVYHSFPDPSKLAGADAEQWMRDNGFGYRAKYIRGSAEIVTDSKNQGESWLDNLLSMKYEDAKAELTKLPGIGAKVADCICLMSLGHLCAVPVDTHVHQIAIRRYTPHLAKYKTVTPAVYDEIGGHFRKLYGDLAGWAHTILFCADLKMFKGMTENGKTNKSDIMSNKRKKQKNC